MPTKNKKFILEMVRRGISGSLHIRRLKPTEGYHRIEVTVKDIDDPALEPQTFYTYVEPTERGALLWQIENGLGYPEKLLTETEPHIIEVQTGERILEGNTLKQILKNQLGGARPHGVSPKTDKIYTEIDDAYFLKDGKMTVSAFCRWQGISRNKFYRALEHCREKRRKQWSRP